MTAPVVVGSSIMCVVVERGIGGINVRMRRGGLTKQVATHSRAPKA
jgi:hypothetical protein